MPNVVFCAGGNCNAVPLWAGPMGVEKTVPMITADSRVMITFFEKLGRGAFHHVETVQRDWCLSSCMGEMRDGEVVMADSRVSLAPREAGCSAFPLTEIANGIGVSLCL